jgi:Bacterial Ig domain
MKHLAVILLAALTALAQEYPDPPDPAKIASLEADIPHTLAVCNITVVNSSELTSALSSISCGQTLCLAAQSTGASFTGNFIYNKDCGSNYVVMRTTRASELPSATTRIKPADAPKLAKVIASAAQGPITARPGSSGLRMLGLEVTDTTTNVNMVVLGSNNSDPKLGPTQTTIASIPRRFIIDRCYIHGANAVTKSSVGVRIDADYVAVFNTYIDEIHDGGGDDQAILILNGQGPFIFRNNFLHAAGENLMFGGGDPAIRLIPSDALIQGNHFWKDPSRKNGDALYKVKNLYELKTGRRQKIVGNVFENFWSGVQSQYYAIVLKSANQGFNCKIDNGYYGQTAHIEFSYNKLINIPQGWVLGRAAACSLIEEGTSHIYIHDNLIEGLGSGHSQDGAPRVFLWSYPIAEAGGEKVYPRHITVTHNTVGSLAPKPSGGVWSLNECRYQHLETQGNYVHDLYFNSNIFPGYWFVAGTQNDEPTITARFLPLRTFRNNLSLSSAATVFSAAPNFARSSYSGLFVNQAGRDYRLTSASAAAYPGADGRPAGADITVLEKCTAGATDSWTGICPGEVQPGNCPTQGVLISQSSIPVGGNSVISAPPGWYGGTFSSSDATKASLHPHPQTLSNLATGIAAGSTNISGAGWTTAAGEANCSLAASPLTITALSDEVLVLDWNQGMPRRLGRYVEGLTEFNLDNQPARYNQNRATPINFAGGTYYIRVKMGCMATNDQWTWQINHWKGPISAIGAAGEIYSDIANSDLAFNWTGTAITKTFSLPLADLISHPDRPAWTWAATPVMQIMGFMSNDSASVPDSRKLDPAAFPLDMRFQIVNVAQGGSFSGWSLYTPNGIGERQYDCAFPTPVTVTAPTESSIISVPTNITVTAQDNVGITKVEYFIGTYNGTDCGILSLKASDNLAPFSWRWDPAAYATGGYCITAKAWDLAGNTNSHTIHVTVSRGGGLTTRLEANGGTVPIIVAPGTAVKLEWFATGATTCEATASTPYGSSLWSGAKSTSGGVQVINPTGSSTYSIACSDGTSTATSSVVVNVAGTCAGPVL